MRNHRFCPICKSKLSNRKIEGFHRPTCDKCGWVHYANPLPSAVAFVHNDENEILLIKRGVAPGKGKWALPSGFVEAHELPEEAVLRELKEETRLQGTLKNLIGVYTEPTRLYGNVLLIAYDMKYTSGRPRAGTDTTDAKFFPANKLPKIPFASHRAIIHDGMVRCKSNAVFISVLKSKISEATITQTHLFYEGSMGIDSTVMKNVGLLPGEKVQVLNYDNGERFETYVIKEKAGSGRIVLYGPAALKGKVGQKLCVLSYVTMSYDAARDFVPKVVKLDSQNRIKH